VKNKKRALSIQDSALRTQHATLGWRRTLRKSLLALSVIAFVLVVAGAVASAQQPKKVPRIGYLSASDPAGESVRSEPIRLALRELGYIEGQNIATEYRYAEGSCTMGRTSRTPTGASPIM
jgi:hypothetical protein